MLHWGWLSRPFGTWRRSDFRQRAWWNIFISRFKKRKKFRWEITNWLLSGFMNFFRQRFMAYNFWRWNCRRCVVRRRACERNQLHYKSNTGVFRGGGDCGYKPQEKLLLLQSWNCRQIGSNSMQPFLLNPTSHIYFCKNQAFVVNSWAP